MKILKLISMICAIQAISISTSYAQTGNNPAGISMPGPQIGVAWGFSYGYENKPEIFQPRIKNMGWLFLKKPLNKQRPI